MLCAHISIGFQHHVQCCAQANQRWCNFIIIIIVILNIISCLHNYWPLLLDSQSGRHDQWPWMPLSCQLLTSFAHYKRHTPTTTHYDTIQTATYSTALSYSDIHELCVRDIAAMYVHGGDLSVQGQCLRHNNIIIIATWTQSSGWPEAQYMYRSLLLPKINIILNKIRTGVVVEHSLSLLSLCPSPSPVTCTAAVCKCRPTPLYY